VAACRQRHMQGKNPMSDPRDFIAVRYSTRWMARSPSTGTVIYDGEYPAIYDTEQEAVDEAIAQNTPDPILRNVAAELHASSARNGEVERRWTTLLVIAGAQPSHGGVTGSGLAGFGFNFIADRRS